MQEIFERYQKARDTYLGGGTPSDLEECIAILEEAVADPAHPPQAEIELALRLTNRVRTPGASPDVVADTHRADTLLEAAAKGAPISARVALELGIAYRVAYLEHGARADANRAMQLFRSAAAGGDEPDGDAYQQIIELADDVWTRTGDPAALDVVIDAYQTALEAMPDLSADQQAWQRNMRADRLNDRYRLSRRPEDATAALAERRLALAVSGQSANRASLAYSLALALEDEAARTRTVDPLREAQAMLSEELARRPAQGIAALLSRRGVAAKRAYDYSGDVDFLDDAVNDQTAAIEAGAGSEAALAVYKTRLSNACCDRYKAGGEVVDLDEAVRHADAAIESLQGNPAERPGMEFTARGRAMALRYERRHVGADLDAALRALGQALDQVRADTGESPWLELNNLADVLIRLEFQRTADIAVLDNALDLLVEAVGLEPDPADLAMVGNSYALGSLTRFRATGQRFDLLEAIARSEESLALTPEGMPARPKRLANLASALLQLGSVDGDVGAVERAVEAIRHAAAAVPPWSYDGSNYQVNLAAALTERYRLTNRRADLAEAEEICARINPPETVNWRVPILTNSAVTLMAVADAAASPNLIDEAARRLTQALDLTEGEDPLRHAILFNLSAALQVQGIAAKRSDLIESALGSLTRLLDALPEPHPIRPQAESALAAGYFVRGLVTKGRADLAAATALGEKALAEQQSHVSGWCATALLLASAYLAADVPAWTGPPGRAERLLREVMVSSPSPAQRIAAASRLGNVLDEGQEQSGASEAYVAGVRAMEELFDRQAVRSHQTQALQEGLGLATRAAVALASQDRVAEAVEVLEAGRTVLAGTALGTTRRRLGALLNAGRGHLADEYLAACADRRRLDGGSGGVEAANAPSREGIRAASRRLDAAVAAITAQPGFASFPRPGPLSPEDLDGLPGACVYVVPGPRGGVAIRVGPGAAPQLWRALPGLAESDLAERADAWAALVTSPVSRTARTWPAEVGAIGEWLWDHCMAAVVDLVGGASDVVLIPCGRLVDLPLHAAWRSGRLKKNSAPIEAGPTCVISQFTVRYAASLRSLLDSIAAADQPVVRMFALADDTLSCALGEVEAAIKTFETVPPAPRLRHRSTHADVLGGLTNAHVAHFACHASFDCREPLSSRVDACRDEPITLAELLDLDLSNVRLVVLSACESAVSDKSLPDEVVNLASALVQAGVAGVIGSLWPVADDTTARLIGRFYALWREVGLAPAVALGRAQAEMASAITDGDVAAASIPTHPEAWAPFVYFGA